MKESMTPSMYIKPDYSADIEAWLARGNQIKLIGRGESAHNKTFNNKTKNAQSAMRAIMSNSVAIAQAQKDNPFVKARAEARNNGLKRYTGSECKKCGSTLKYVSTNNCVICNRTKAADRMRAKRALS